MRAARPLARPLALLVAPALVVGLALTPAGAAETAECALAVDSADPVAVTLTVSGRAATPAPQSVTVRSSGGGGSTQAVPSRPTPATPPFGYTADVEVTQLPDGLLTATVVDSVPMQPSQMCTAPLLLPATPVLTAVEPTPVNLARQASVVVRGTQPLSQVGATVRVTVTDQPSQPLVQPQRRFGSGRVAADGTFAVVVDTTGLADGPISATASATFPDGTSRSRTSPAISSSKDVMPPSTPATATATGTTQAQPRTTVAGSIPSGEGVTSVRIDLAKAGSPVTATVTVAPSGTAYTTQIDASAFPDGPITATVRSFDAAGNPSQPRGATFLKDATGPDVIDLTADDATIATATKVFVSGQTGESNTTVTITVTDRNGATVVQAVTPAAASPGRFTRDVDVTSLAEGPLTVTATARDSKNNLGPVADPVSATKDTVAPVVTSLSATATNAADTALVVTGTGEPGTSVKITATSGATSGTAPTVTVGQDGSFRAEITPTGLADGTVTVTATATDAVGNVGPTVTTTALRDTTLPTVTGLTAAKAKLGATATTVTGTTEPGSSVLLTATDSAGTTATATVIATGNGAISTALDLAALLDGPITVTAVATDPARNTGPSATVQTAKDVVVPTITGLRASDVNASSRSTTITGTLSESGTSVTVTVSDGTTSVSSTLNELGTALSATLDLSTLADGAALSVTATATDGVGNVGPAATTSLLKDTVAPVLSAVTATDATIARPSPRVTGTTAPGQSVTVQAKQGSASTTQTVTADDAGDFVADLDVAGFTDGPFTVTVTVDDGSGNTTSATDDAVKDLTAPTLTGLGASGTTQAAPVTTVTGTTDPGQSVVVVVTQAARSVTKTVTGDGTGAFSADLDLTGFEDGDVTVTATATDAVGNATTAATTGSRDATGPIVAALAATATRVGVQSSTVTGVTEPGASVTVTATGPSSAPDAPGPVTATGPAGADGRFSLSVDLTGFPDGSVAFRAVATDGSANSGPASTTTALRDTVAPSVSQLAASPVSSTATSTTVGGTTEPGATVTVTVTDRAGAVATATGTADSDGRFSVAVPAGSLADGTLTVRVTARDVVGNTGSAATANTNKDATLPTVTGLAGTDTTAAQGTTTVSGTLNETGTTVVVTATDGAASVTRTLSGISGTALSTTLDLSGLADGAITLTARATDVAGNTGPVATTSLTKDTVAPALAGLAATPVNAATPATTVSGRTDPGQAVTVTVTSGGKAATGTATAGSDGRFSAPVDLSALPDGAFTATVTATDRVGNPSSAQTGSTKDATAPVLAGLAATGTTTARPSTTVTGTTDPGQAVVAVVTQGERSTTEAATAGSDGRFTRALDLSSYSDGLFTVTVRATDAAGNTTSATTTAVRDTTGPVVAALAATATRAGTSTSTVTGTTEPGAPVALTARSGSQTVTGSATAGSDGRFSAVLDLATLPDGTVTTTATATDAVGNAGPVATTTALRDTVAPVVSALAASASSADGPRSTVTGTTEALSTVALTATDRNGRTVNGTATAASSGSFTTTMDLSGLEDGPVTLTARATDPSGNGGPSATTTTTRSSAASRYVGLTSPVRVLDSRPGSGNVGTSPGKKRGPVLLDLSGRVPAGARSAVLNVTVTQPDRPGFVVVHPGGSSQPPTSNVNYAAGQTQANEVVTALSAARTALVTIDSTGPTHVVVDLVGYFSAELGAAGHLVALTPTRVLGSELRTNLGSSVGSSSIEVDLTDSVPAGSTGAILNVTVAAPTQPGFVVAYPSGVAQPPTSNVNFAAGQTQANEVVTQIGSNGRVRLTLSRGTARLVVDVVGAVVPSSTAGSGRFTPLAAPVRVLDTRDGTGTSGTTRRSAATPVTLALPSAIPADAKGVVLNVTSTGSTANGFVVAYPGGSTQPPTSNVNFRRGQNQANEVVVGLGSGRRVTLGVGGGGSPTTHLIADVVGYVR